MRGATDDKRGFSVCAVISIHAPLAGCDSRGFLWCLHRVLISIHAPLAGCDGAFAPLVITAAISIHAPLAGCDLWDMNAPVVYVKFQSTHPLRGATSSVFRRGELLGFQSTHPLRGATAFVGCSFLPHLNFNPRTPCGVRRHCRDLMCLAKAKFQSTHPLRGATFTRFCV